MPTLREQGIELVGGTDRGIVVPKGTPKDAIAQWEQVLKKAMENPEVVSSFAKKGTAIVFMGSDEYRTYFEETFSKWEEVAKKVGVYKREGA